MLIIIANVNYNQLDGSPQTVCHLFSSGLEGFSLSLEADTLSKQRGRQLDYQPSEDQSLFMYC